MTLEEETEPDDEPHTASASAAATADIGDSEHCKFHGKKVN